MTGPGQNPEYDTPDEQTATIPFKTEIHINKMTVDRLWCYVPEVESWVKAEDISYNQSGKLYNSLDVKVIDLTTIDFDNATTLADVGVYPDAKMLYFHDRSGYTYTGEYTYDAFSLLHELDFIYPETIYNYTCIYYKDAMNPWLYGRGLTNKSGTMYPTPSLTVPSGTSKISFVANKRVVLEEEITNSEGTWYKVRYFSVDTNEKYKEGYILVDLINVIEPPISLEGTTQELGRASFSCCIGDWNPDWDVFVASSWKTDENGDPISPDLYRDTELLLNWEYFGFDKNLYRPAGYPDGIYLWDARTWDEDHSFTFEELVKTGTQYVIYPVETPNYKIIANSNSKIVFYEDDVFGNYDTWYSMMTWDKNNYNFNLNPLPSQNIYDIGMKY
jgi:hypothetical protein